MYFVIYIDNLNLLCIIHKFKDDVTSTQVTPKASNSADSKMPQ